MAPFQAQRFGGLRDVSVVPIQFLQDLCPFKAQHSLGQSGAFARSGSIGCERVLIGAI